MTVPNYKPVYRPSRHGWYAMAAGAAFWTVLGVLGWSFYKVVAG